MPLNLESVALVAITKGGAKLLARLKAALPQADAFVPEKFKDEAPFASPVQEPLKELLADLWPRYKGIVAVVSLGALVRSIATLLKDKRTDPGLIAIDEAGGFVISVLSGHLGGANALANELAKRIGATPIITTASDSLGTIGVDILGRDLGWALEGIENVTAVSACVVNDEPVGIFQEAGEPTFWPKGRPLPRNLRTLQSLEALASTPLSACLIVTDRLITLPLALARKTVVYRPKSLVLGVGCDRGVPLEELETLVLKTLQERGLSFLSVRALATIDIRKNEPAIVQFAQTRGLPLLTFAKEELNRVKDVPNPSTMAMKYVGVIGVAEPSAILGGNFGELIVPKVKLKKATLAIARVRFEGGQDG
jgi:cobalt-precorrin 5A hydrolase